MESHTEGNSHGKLYAGHDPGKLSALVCHGDTKDEDHLALARPKHHLGLDHFLMESSNKHSRPIYQPRGEVS